ncbi:MAG: acetylglutamate kinase [Woeseiaceae bacterium]|nr:acetylglutamate kinase [Woeseiaceae bacterium]
MTASGDRSAMIAALRHATPYIRLFKGEVFVLKAGGDVFADAEAARRLMEQIGILHQLGIRLVLVHGGGPQSTAIAGRLDLETRMVDGRRVTNADTLEVSTMALNGTVNTRILALCRELQVPAVGLSGVAAGLVRARRRPPVTRSGGDRVDYGFVGDIIDVDPRVLRVQLDQGLLPVVSPLSCDDAGVVLNINADTVAASLAAALGARKLLLLTGAPGILRDREKPETLISYVDRRELARLRDNGALAEGMLPKAAAIDAAIANGVERVHVISHAQPDSLLLEIFTNEGTGTLIVDDIAALTPAEQAAEAPTER